MRKIVAGLFISLDGVVEAPETWTGPYHSPEVDGTIYGAMAAADTLLLGRRTTRPSSKRSPPTTTRWPRR